MNALLGATALWFALGTGALALCCALPLGAGTGRRAGSSLRHVRRAAPLLLALAALAAIGAWGILGAALWQHDLQLRYVAEWSSVLVVPRQTLAALAAGDLGVRFTWSVALAVVALGVAMHALWPADESAPRRATPVASHSTLVTLVAAALVAALVSVLTRGTPFALLPTIPPDGRGLPPTLQHPLATVQPLLQLLGFAAALLPLAHLAAAIIDGAPATQWRDAVRRALRRAWLLQTVAIAAGALWAQQATGWFGTWLTWAPWSTMALLPWLGATLALVFERVFAHRDALRARARVPGDSAPGDNAAADAPPVVVAVPVALASCLAGFAAWQARVGTAASVTLPTTGVRLETTAVAIALGMLAAGALALLTLAWAARRARVPALLLVLALLVSTAGVTASHWRRESVAALEMGTPIAMTDPLGQRWSFTSQGVSSYREPDHAVLAVAIAVAQGAERPRLLTTAQRQYMDLAGEPLFDAMTVVGQRHTPLVTIATTFSQPMSRDVAAVRVGFVPGTTLLAAGVLLLLVAVPLAAQAARAPSPSQSTDMPSDSHADDPAEAAIARARARQRTCATCGPRPEPDARFCSECGAALEGVCPHCGAPLPSAASRFCGDCGASVTR